MSRWLGCWGTGSGIGVWCLGTGSGIGAWRWGLALGDGVWYLWLGSGVGDSATAGCRVPALGGSGSAGLALCRAKAAAVEGLLENASGVLVLFSV